MLLSLGLFVFEINSTAFQQLQHATAQRWSTNNRVGSRPNYQYLGPGEESITLEGTLYPQFTGGLSDLSMLKQMAASGKAYLLISGNGRIHGLWFIESISETHTQFLDNGQPRKIGFTLTMKRTDDDRVDQLGDLSEYIKLTNPNLSGHIRHANAALQSLG